MVLGSCRWFQVVVGGFRWLWVVSGGCRWLHDLVFKPKKINYFQTIK